MSSHLNQWADVYLSNCLQINNAGIYGMGKRQVTSNGLELTMATNHFGHFLLTNLLLGETHISPAAAATAATAYTVLSLCTPPKIYEHNLTIILFL